MGPWVFIARCNGVKDSDMDLQREPMLARLVSEWFHAHWLRTDGKFSKRNTFAYNANCVVVNAELLWNHYQYYLHATGRSAFVPSKASFFNALRGGGIELKHVKNAYVGSIRLAAAVRALPTAMRSGPVWHPSGSHLDRSELCTQV